MNCELINVLIRNRQLSCAHTSTINRETCVFLEK